MLSRLLRRQHSQRECRRSLLLKKKKNNASSSLATGLWPRTPDTSQVTAQYKVSTNKEYSSQSWNKLVRGRLLQQVQVAEFSALGITCGPVDVLGRLQRPYNRGPHQHQLFPRGQATCWPPSKPTYANTKRSTLTTLKRPNKDSKRCWPLRSCCPSK